MTDETCNFGINRSVFVEIPLTPFNYCWTDEEGKSGFEIEKEKNMPAILSLASSEPEKEQPKGVKDVNEKIQIQVILNIPI